MLRLTVALLPSARFPVVVASFGSCDPLALPAVNGVSGRVGLLRGYGNAIVPQVAAEFIVAYMEAQ